MFTLRCPRRLFRLERPLVMGILNRTPDSFYDGGRYTELNTLLQRAELQLEQGADILDIGGVSTRPGAEEVGQEEELRRVVPAVEALHRHFPDAVLSVDTFRAAVARAAVETGAQMINDVSAGNWDPELLPEVARLGVPYVLMHAQGLPATMQQAPVYEGDVVDAVLDFFGEKLCLLCDLGIEEVLLDPGFGFGKTLEHNYRLLAHVHLFARLFERPILVGLSRKSMIYKLLDTVPEQALNGTTALHVLALQQGAGILRVHDVAEARQTIALWQYAQSQS